MGSDLFRNCKTAVWEQARNAVVSKDHPLWASLNASSTLESFNFTSFTAGFNRGNVAK